MSEQSAEKGMLTDEQVEWLREGHADMFGNQVERVERIVRAQVTEALRIERVAACMYGDPDGWARGTGMNRPYWRRRARVTPAEKTSD